MIGKTLGHFRVLERVGEGAMGVVYRAHDPDLGRDVALKVLPEDLARDAERLRRFRREARALATVHHPSVAMIHGIEQSGSTHFLVLERGHFVRWTPDGRHVIFRSPTERATLRVGRDGGDPEPVFEFPEAEARIDYPTWSPDGRWVLFDRFQPEGGDIWVLEDLF